jgi:hypothetical protein
MRRSWNEDVIYREEDRLMKLIGNLKEEVQKAKSKEEKKELIEKAGMELDDDELETVAGGSKFLHITDTLKK